MTAASKDRQALFLIGAVEKLERNDRKEIFADPQEECVVVDVDLLCELDSSHMAQKKKGSFGGEMKAVTAMTGGSGGGGGEDVSPCGGRGLASSKGMITVHTTGAVFPGMRSSSFRRRKAPPRWGDPRGVLLFFATLSSMGTIILLYFTLSMGRMDEKEGSNYW